MIPRVSKEELKAIFAKNLNRLMFDNNTKAIDIANTLDLPYMTVSDWVRGKSIPRMDKIEMLANYFDVSKAELIEEQKETPSSANEGEPEWLIQYRSLSSEQQAMVQERIRTFEELNKKSSQ